MRLNEYIEEAVSHGKTRSSNVPHPEDIVEGITMERFVEILNALGYEEDHTPGGNTFGGMESRYYIIREKERSRIRAHKIIVHNKHRKKEYSYEYWASFDTYDEKLRYAERLDRTNKGYNWSKATIEELAEYITVNER